MSYLFKDQATWNQLNQSLATAFGIEYNPTPMPLDELEFSSYNHVSGFEGLNHTTESKQAIATTLKGRTRSASHCENLSKALAGRKVSPEGLAKLRANRKPMSEETKAKIRAKRATQNMDYLKGRKLSEETKAKIRAKRALQTNIKNQYSSK